MQKSCFLPHSKTDDVFLLAMTLLLVSLRLVGVLGFWGLRTLKLEMSESDDVLCILGVFHHAYPRMISTVHMKQFVGSAFFFQPWNQISHLSHFRPLTFSRNSSISGFGSCSLWRFSTLLQAKHPWSYRVKPWIGVGSRGAIWWRKWCPNQVMKQLKFIKRSLNKVQAIKVSQTTKTWAFIRFYVMMISNL